MKSTELPPPPHPPLLRLILFLGRPLGIDFVPQHYVRVLYHMGKYAGCKGPGLIYYNRMTETLGQLVFIGGQISEYALDNMVSRDVLPVSMTVSTTISYDPSLGVDLASVLTRIPKAAYVSIAGTYIRWGLLAAANQYNAAELTQTDVRVQIETAVRDRVNEELKFLGLKINGKLRITRVEMPASLRERHETIAQRRASILAGAEFHPAEYRRALVSEVLEHLSRSEATESFVNFGDVLEAYAAEHAPAVAPPEPGAAPHIIDQPAQQRSLPDKSSAR
ncbi:MAG: SPFH domain-containing protein, partial [Anaerolineales bacterium]